MKVISPARLENAAGLAQYSRRVRGFRSFAPKRFAWRKCFTPPFRAARYFTRTANAAGKLNSRQH